MKILKYSDFLNESVLISLNDFEVIKDLPVTGFLIENDHIMQAIVLEYLFKNDYKLGSTWNMWKNDTHLNEEKLLIPENMKKLFDYTYDRTWFSDKHDVKLNWWNDIHPMSGDKYQVIFEEFESSSIDEKFHCKFDDYFKIKEGSRGKYHSKKFNL